MIPVTGNRGFCDELLHNLQVIFSNIEPKLGRYSNCTLKIFRQLLFKTQHPYFIFFIKGESGEIDQRKAFVGFLGLFSLFVQIFRQIDKKFIKQIWDLHRKVRLSQIVRDCLLVIVTKLFYISVILCKLSTFYSIRFDMYYKSSSVE